ncbi:cysteine--tRNA ligase [Spiroplasma turonicum]|uniref:Cysteine--tRNA ligase n=1 Tax=Spiroplasma turonicum TaxID=216946 RepID=A0A0K1P4R2_9MOLU|nr:cysteine--tRNA ligase [Spiroplasma turonicum]AKU79276.1 cysteinyl-tRNA synthetase [Spiroplasma turonicum]ALX70299.1 cysteinyl-tRNA synthetase [Spiroplasma turonicum]
MKIFDSFTGSLKNIDTKNITMYTCGPTVYDYIHIGNARPLILADTLVRFFKYLNINYNYLLNITDIDDKIINKALSLKISEEELVEKYRNAFLVDMKNLNLVPPTSIISISSKIDEIIFFIDDLLEKKFAYIVDGSVYFDISKFKSEYGNLSKQDVSKLLAGVRIDLEENKKNPGDFVLWKKTDTGKKWLSKWSLGRPGWHTECALLIDNYFKKTIDIHIGGIDLKFPHHENERIQFLAKNNIEISKNWMHNGHLALENVKMSKSLGNIITVKDFLSDYDANTLKYIFLTSSYRQPLNITEQHIKQAEDWNEKIYKLLKTLNWKLAIKEVLEDFKTPIDDDFIPYNFEEKFINYMSDDLNTPMVITLIDEIIKYLNKQIKNGKVDLCFSHLKSLLKCLGFKYDIKEINENDIKNLMEWKGAQEIKNYPLADSLRKKLIERNII